MNWDRPTRWMNSESWIAWSKDPTLHLVSKHLSFKISTFPVKTKLKEKNLPFSSQQTVLDTFVTGTFFQFQRLKLNQLLNQCCSNLSLDLFEVTVNLYGVLKVAADFCDIKPGSVLLLYCFTTVLQYSKKQHPSMW